MSKTFILFPKILKREQVVNWQRFIYLVSKYKQPYVPGDKVDGIIPFKKSFQWQCSKGHLHLKNEGCLTI